MAHRVASQHHRTFSQESTRTKIRTLSFGKEIRRRRIGRGLTLEQLSERAGLTPNYIGSVENGRRDPSLSTVLALARGLEVEPWELFGAHRELSPVALEMAQMLDALSPELQATVLELLRHVSRKRR